MFIERKCYTRDEIHAQLGGSVQAYLPTVNGQVVAGCFNLNYNPNAPEIVLPGIGPIIKKSAEQFESQENGVPVFIKREVNKWEYSGKYMVDKHSFDINKINKYAEKAERLNDVSSVLFLKRAD